MAAGLLRTARSGSVVLSRLRRIFIHCAQPRANERRTPNNTRGWRRSADGASAGRWSRGEWRAELQGRESMAAGLLRTARSGSVVLSLYPLLEPRAERRAERHPRWSPIRRWGFGWSVEPR